MAARLGGLALGAAFAALAGCIQDDGSRFNPIEVVSPSFDEERERELGMEVDREIQKKVRIIHDPVVTDFVNDLGQAVVSGIEPQPFVYRFRVIEEDSLNAFALPGGYVYFHSETLLVSSSVAELAGVMGHEVAHVKARHHFRMQQQQQLPSLLTRVAGLAGAVATGEPGLMVTAEAVNVAIQLRYSREFETEADQLGGVFAARAGYDPAGVARFFDRILEEQERHPNEIPPYLYSHPAVEDRIQAVRRSADSLEPRQPPDARLEEALLHAQARLALLRETRQTTLLGAGGSADRTRSDPLLAEAEGWIQAGHIDRALFVLARAESLEPNDPRVPFRIGELLFDAGRTEAAVGAWRRTARLDPSRALVFYKLGLAYKQLGDRQRAAYALEQALFRAGDASPLRPRLEWEIEKITFPLVQEAGFADGSGSSRAETPAGTTREWFRVGDPRMVWWARLGPHFVPHAGRISVRWIDPDGRELPEQPVKTYRKPYVGSQLDFPEDGVRRAGRWTAEALLDDEVIDRRSVEVRSLP